MKKICFNFILLCSLFFLKNASLSFADEMDLPLVSEKIYTDSKLEEEIPRYHFEFWSGSLVSLDFSTTEHSGSKSKISLNFFSFNTTTYSPTGEWPKLGYFIVPQFQINFSFGVNYAAEVSKSTIMHAILGVNYSLESDVRKSVFIDLRGGLFAVNDLEFTEETYFFELAIGKRFPLISNVALSPKLSLKMRGPLEEDSKIVFVYSIIPFQLSVLF